MKTALILGVGGQDGSFLADILLERGYTVHGFHRHSSVDNLVRVRHCLDRITLHRGDMTDHGSVRSAVKACRPDEIYNVADQDNVSWSRAAPEYQRLVTCEAVRDLLIYVRNKFPRTRVFQPLSSTMFGDAPAPQSETSPVGPASPYAMEKLRAWDACREMRAAGVHVSCGIMFNHDSPRRGPGYLLQSVCRQAVDVAAGRRDAVVVGSLDQRVDVGFARDYMEAAVDMLQLPHADDWCVGTGEAWTIREMAEEALMCAWGKIAKFAKPLLYIKEDPSLVSGPQPTYVADATKANTDFGFAPKVKIGASIEMLVQHFQEKRR